MYHSMKNFLDLQATDLKLHVVVNGNQYESGLHTSLSFKLRGRRPIWATTAPHLLAYTSFYMSSPRLRAGALQPRSVQCDELLQPCATAAEARTLGVPDAGAWRRGLCRAGDLAGAVELDARAEEGGGGGEPRGGSLGDLRCATVN